MKIATMHEEIFCASLYTSDNSLQKVGLISVPLKIVRRETEDEMARLKKQ